MKREYVGNALITEVTESRRLNKGRRSIITSSFPVPVPGRDDKGAIYSQMGAPDFRGVWHAGISV